MMVERGVSRPILATMASLPLIAWAAWGHVAQGLLLAWLALGWGAAALRLHRARTVLAMQPGPDSREGLEWLERLQRLDRGLRWHSLPASLFLVATALLFFGTTDIHGNRPLWALAVMPVLLVSAQVAASAPPLRVVLLMTQPALATLVLLCFWQGELPFRLLGLGVLLYAVAVVRIAIESDQALTAQVALSLSNEELARRLRNEAERADAANQAKSRFLAAASHDIRQPVSTLALFLASFDDAGLTGRNAQLIGPVRQTATHLRDMLDGVLDLSLAESDNVVARPAPVVVQTLFDTLEREFGPAAEAKQLLLRTVPTGARVLADALLLERILRNLVGNALRYTERGGVLVGARRRDGTWSLEVWDTGPGIASADQQRVFHEFTRGGHAGREAEGGLGLGLAIARRFARAMGSDVTLRSVPGRGSVFRLRLPAAPPLDA